MELVGMSLFFDDDYSVLIKSREIRKDDYIKDRDDNYERKM